MMHVQAFSSSDSTTYTYSSGPVWRRETLARGPLPFPHVGCLINPDSDSDLESTFYLNWNWNWNSHLPGRPSSNNLPSYVHRYVSSCTRRHPSSGKRQKARRPQHSEQNPEKRREKKTVGKRRLDRRINVTSSTMSNIGSENVDVNHALDGQSQVTWVVSIVSLACIISTTAVVLRLFTRLRILHICGPDDAFMGLAQLIAIGAAVAIGLGKFHNPHSQPMEEGWPKGRLDATISWLVSNKCIGYAR